MRAQKSELTDRQIADAICQGRREGQNAMMGRYARLVFALIFRLVPDVMDAQELTQDTFLKAFRNIGRYDADRASLSTWLSRIAYRVTLDFLKRQHPVVVSMESSEVWQTDISNALLDAALSTGREERIRHLEALMDELPADERMLLTLYYFDNCPLAEISYIMDVNTGALANRLHRIRKKLYRKLIEYERDEL